MRKPRALRPGDRIAIVAPASPFDPAELEAGVQELETLGFEAVYDDSVFAREAYVAGPADLRAQALQRAWADPSIAAIIAARGGYGSVQLLPYLDPGVFERAAKPFVGYSDNTSLLSWLTLSRGVVAFHGPMIERRLSRGEQGYDRATFLRSLMEPAPLGAVRHESLEILRRGTATGLLVGGTLTQLAGSLGTPYAFCPPAGCVLFLDEVGERPYRVDRMFTQLRQAGIVDRASALVFNELPRCHESPGTPHPREVVARLTSEFHGPVLFGLPSGHTDAPTLTLPLGVRATVRADGHAELIIDEAAVS